MNDRGLNLTPTEMLKGYILSRVKDPQKRSNLNEFWRSIIYELHQYGNDVDITFFQKCLRAKYAETIRDSRAGSANEDFE